MCNNGFSFFSSNVPQENKPLPKEPDDRTKKKTPKSKKIILESTFFLEVMPDLKAVLNNFEI